MHKTALQTLKCAIAERSKSAAAAYAFKQQPKDSGLAFLKRQSLMKIVWFTSAEISFDEK